MKTKKLNVKLLRKIQKHILAEPKRADMDAFILRGKEIAVNGLDVPKCGTVGCIAGWAVTLSTRQRVAYRDIPGRAKKLLGLTNEQSTKLFHESYWPDKFSEELASTDAQTPAHAMVMSERIEHFIKTKGDE